MDEKKIKILITIGSIIFVIIVATFILYSNRDKSVVDTEKDEKNKIENRYDKIKGIITEIADEENDSVDFKVRDYDNTEEFNLTYNGNCEVKNIYGKDIYFDKLKIGDVVVVGYDKEITNLKYIYIDDSILQYKELEKYTLDGETHYIGLEDKKYRLKKETYVYSKTNKKNLTIYDLDENDIVTLNIKGKDIISVIVEKGHGYVELANYDAFLGYSLVVNDDVSYDIKENLKISVPEGKNEFTIKNDRLTGTVSVYNFAYVDKIIDIKKITFEEKKEGKVKFYVEPKNARLYINGKSYYYNEEITLDYGKYNFTVESSGYNSYAGIFELSSAEKVISVYLKEKTKTAEPTKSTDSDKKTDTDENEDESSEEPTASATTKE